MAHTPQHKKDETTAELVDRLGVEYRKTLIANMAAVLGNRPLRGSKLTPDRELDLWLLPTSPPALAAAKAGASLEEVWEANRAYAAGMTAAGRSDDEILKACAKFRWQLGKAAGQDDLRRETKYHERQYAKAIAAGRIPGMMPPAAIEMGEAA